MLRHLLELQHVQYLQYLQYLQRLLLLGMWAPLVQQVLALRLRNQLLPDVLLPDLFLQYLQHLQQLLR
jgi:hypothetical protein